MCKRTETKIPILPKPRKQKMTVTINAQEMLSLFTNVSCGEADKKTIIKNATLRNIEYCESIGFMSDAQKEFFKRNIEILPQKAVKALALAIDFIATGDPKSIEKVTAAFTTICLLLDAGTKKPQTFENARFTLSAKGNENSRPLDGIRAQSLRKAIGSISNMSTVSAQTSRTVGVNGLMGCMGATSKVSAHEFTIHAGSDSNPFLLAYGKALSKLPEGVLIARMQEGKDKEKA